MAERRGKNKKVKRDKKDKKKKKDRRELGRHEENGRSKRGRRGESFDSAEHSDSYEYSYDEYSESRSASRSSRGRNRRHGRSRSRHRQGHSSRCQAGRAGSHERRGKGHSGPFPSHLRTKGGGHQQRSPPRRLQLLGNTGSGDHHHDMEDFIYDNGLDARTVQALHALSEGAQKKVMGTDGGENCFALKEKVNNPSAVVMSRIRRL